MYVVLRSFSDLEEHHEFVGVNSTLAGAKRTAADAEPGSVFTWKRWESNYFWEALLVKNFYAYTIQRERVMP